MNLIKRNKSVEEYCKIKLFNSLRKISNDLDITNDNLTSFIDKLNITNNITTEELVDYVSGYLYEKVLNNYDYAVLASRVVLFNINKSGFKTFDEYVNFFVDIFNNDFIDTYNRYKDDINEIVLHDKYVSNYIGLKTLTSYLLKYNNKIENPCYIWMRVSISINSKYDSDIESIKKTYKSLLNGFYIHGSPTLFNSGLKNQQLSSCYLLQMDDSIDSIYDSLKDIAKISQGAGGVGLGITGIRNEGSKIRKVDISNGIVGVLKNINSTVNYVNQSGKRPGSAAVYLEPWHPDILKFVGAKRFLQNEEFSAKDLFYGLWIPDIFMRRVKSGGKWSLFDPSVCKNLHNTHGKEFEELYEYYENKGMYTDQIDPRDLWDKIIDTQIETGGPYILFKDTCNIQSNQNNLGTIRCSNLCAEIIQYSSSKSISVCNLASINLVKMLRNNKFDFNLLKETVELIVENLNKIIDVNHYPSDSASLSNLENRPIGIGVQGLADLFHEMKYSYEDEEAKLLNKNIFESIYYYALNKSCNLARKYNKTYKNYSTSLVSKGLLHFDFYDLNDYKFINDFDSLRLKIRKFGLYNSLLIAQMPTATTSQILGNYDCVEPWICNIYYKKVLNGNFKIVNRRMYDDIKKIGLWDDNMKNKILNNNGSIRNILSIPENIRRIYKTIYELDSDVLIDYYIDRAPFIDQSQSMNIYINSNEEDIYNKINRLIFKAWKCKLKTGLYYLRIETKYIKPKELCESCSS